MTRRYTIAGNEGWRTSPRPQRTDADRLRMHGRIIPMDADRRAELRRTWWIAPAFALAFALAWIATP